jgi:hypothetical protein
VPNWKKVASLPPEERISLYHEYLKKRPNDHQIWFDLGLAHKLLRDWPASRDANLRAVELFGRPEEPAWWNLGIAATALRDWPLARKAWRGYGLDIAAGDGPIEVNYGTMPVRLPVGEIVWGDRIDPARVIVRNVPFPDSGFRWGDVVLHDGAPNGERRRGDQIVPVFDVLEKWGASEIPTLRANVQCATADDSAALVDLFERRHFAAEDWTANVMPLCKACSEGLLDEHDHTRGNSSTERAFGIAAPLGLARQLLEEWRAESPADRSFADPETAG